METVSYLREFGENWLNFVHIHCSVYSNFLLQEEAMRGWKDPCINFLIILALMLVITDVVNVFFFILLFFIQGSVYDFP